MPTPPCSRPCAAFWLHWGNEKEISTLSKEIEKTVQAIYPNESLILQSIKGAVHRPAH
jgi:hypothetical protein